MDGGHTVILDLSPLSFLHEQFEMSAIAMETVQPCVLFSQSETIFFVSGQSG